MVDISVENGKEVFSSDPNPPTFRANLQLMISEAVEKKKGGNRWRRTPGNSHFLKGTVRFTFRKSKKNI